MNRKKIAVLFGGHSTEYEVSLESAHAVITHIDKEKYELYLIGIDRHTGQWYWYRNDPEKIRNDSWNNREDCIPAAVSTDRTVHGICFMEEGKLRKISLDAALPVLHGKNGEDGTVQGVFELAGIPVIGCGLLSSALCMDKELAHRIVSAAGIRVAESITVKPGYNPQELSVQAERLGYPLFVKPVRAGSSFGITKVARAEELLPAVENAFAHDSEVILEEMIRGFEVGCAVLGNEEPVVGEVDEIELSDGFFDYEEKYTLKTSEIYVPARISPDVAEKIKEAALVIYRALKCSDFARVDLFLTPEGDIVFNEVNTIPGFTAHSRYPGMLKAAGMSFEEIIDRILAL